MEVVLVPFIVEWQTQQSFGQSVEGRVVTPTLTPPPGGGASICKGTEGDHRKGEPGRAWEMSLEKEALEAESQRDLNAW